MLVKIDPKFLSYKCFFLSKRTFLRTEEFSKMRKESDLHKIHFICCLLKLMVHCLRFVVTKCSRYIFQLCLLVRMTTLIPKKLITEITEKHIQVSLAIRGGYDLEKFRTANTKIGSLGLN